MHFRILHVISFSDFIESNIVLIGYDAFFFSSSYYKSVGLVSTLGAGNEPTKAAYLSKQIRFARTRWSKFYNIKVLLHERKQPL